MQRFTVPGQLAGLNEYTKACRTHWAPGARLKREQTEAVAWCCKGLKPVKGPVTVCCHWVEPDRARDLDNIAFGKKFVLDALVEDGVLPDDNQDWVVGLRDTFAVDRRRPRVEVTIYEHGELS